MTLRAAVSRTPSLSSLRCAAEAEELLQTGTDNTLCGTRQSRRDDTRRSQCGDVWKRPGARQRHLPRSSSVPCVQRAKADVSGPVGEVAYKRLPCRPGARGAPGAGRRRPQTAPASKQLSSKSAQSLAASGGDILGILEGAADQTAHCSRAASSTPSLMRARPASAPLQRQAPETQPFAAEPAPCIALLAAEAAEAVSSAGQAVPAAPAKRAVRPVSAPAARWKRPVPKASAYAERPPYAQISKSEFGSTCLLFPKAAANRLGHLKSMYRHDFTQHKLPEPYVHVLKHATATV
eukprot:TRINITY_DN101672_c0_g1_i1.p1 TRINITY_DN101672_c0_g1~~TRINITY_DN101672_c0_g1_i1.p1  ORF type:complete len:293 (+),score=47.33 TRINITY_DN101672_c0_g1_i1:90-968(+)